MSEEYQWIQLGYKKGKDGKKEGIFFQKRELYQLYDTDWSKDVTSTFDLSLSLVCTAKHGGPIAITRDPTEFHQSDIQEQIIAVYNAAGKRLSSFEYKDPKPKENGQLFAFGWLSNLHLVCLSTTWNVSIFNLYGRCVKWFSLTTEIMSEKVLRCVVWDEGLVLLSRKFRVHIVSNLTDFDEEPDFAALSTLKINFDDIEDLKNDIKMHVTERLTGDDRIDLDVFLLVKGQKSITRVATDQKTDTKALPYSFLDFSLSPNGQLLALYTADNGVWVTKTDFIDHVQTPITHQAIQKAPDSMKWCGSDCVCLYWAPSKSDPRAKLLMIGPTKEVKQFRNYVGAIFIESEVDGLKIISSENYDFLHSVPQENRQIFKIGSLENAAVLFDAFVEFEEKKASSIKKIRKIYGDLQNAVITCVVAAGYEFNPLQQNRLLKAASYGKSFITKTPVLLPGQDTSELNKHHSLFVDMCRTLRVLNSVRDHKVGIPLSKMQFDVLSPAGLIRRLTASNQHLLAFKICSYLSMEKQKNGVLLSWAKAKVCSMQSEEVILEAILAKCKNKISYSDVATTALRNRKKHLASKLLLHETYSGNQVPLLIEMNTPEDTKDALRKAIASGETDLLHLVLLTMRERMTDERSFVSTIFEPEFKTAKDFYFSFLKQQGGQKEIEFLRKCYFIADTPSEEGALLVMESFLPFFSKDQKIEKLKDAKKEFSRKQEFYIESKFCDFQLKLLQKQYEFDQFIGKELFTGLSVIETIQKVIEENYKAEGMKIAKKLKSQFKVSDKNFCWVILDLFCRLGKWEELRRFSQEKRPAIGFESFIEMCKKHGNLKEAEYYSQFLKK